MMAAVNNILSVCLSLSLYSYPSPSLSPSYILSLLDYTELTTSSVMQVSVCD